MNVGFLDNLGQLLNFRANMIRESSRRSSDRFDALFGKPALHIVHHKDRIQLGVQFAHDLRPHACRPDDPKPHGDLVFGNPASDTTGTFPASAQRVLLLTPSARNFSALTWGNTLGVLSKAVSMCPPSRSFTIGAVPL